MNCVGLKVPLPGSPMNGMKGAPSWTVYVSLATGPVPTKLISCTLTAGFGAVNKTSTSRISAWERFDSVAVVTLSTVLGRLLTEMFDG